MILNTLFTDPMIFVAWVVAIILALTFHEFSHALASAMMGDQTAKSLGRLTLNPLSHVSGLGFIMLLFVGFGWGKPVPFNPYNLKYHKWGPALVALAGPISNLLLAFVSGLALHYIVVLNWLPPENLLVQFLNIFVILNVILMLFNLIPIPPLDGSKVLFSFLSSPRYAKFVLFLETRGPYLLLFLLILDNIIGINIFGRLFRFTIEFVYNLIF
ncbi:site-2 protease family protein [Candidatus Falkowbacteria bacterium CG10_big_fil_rev_8_21_14_0_10_39_11]|uniref:Site-2 protease family protein n=1 Tax=Candidatus Falkowbacteria bacterium CG10_big_fil_rev_8_21_14_0_10_39_11 TaxID=1974565 RepID=A0A2H0V5R8_9BACT|nr:MAG: site-2 protease family protein [Candidatus Falkowbacteria bacterium CG10_big_fil_rev_8_21_14_0_10_39_11]